MIWVVRWYEAVGEHEVLGPQAGQVDGRLVCQAVRAGGDHQQVLRAQGDDVQSLGRPRVADDGEVQRAGEDALLQLRVAALHQIHPHPREHLVERGQQVGDQIGGHRGAPPMLTSPTSTPDWSRTTLTASLARERTF